MRSVNIDAVRRSVNNDREGHGLLLEGNLGQGIVSIGKSRMKSADHTFKNGSCVRPAITRLMKSKV
jgi:hypothetical protein